MSKAHLADLDGLRGVAALAVVTSHMVKPFGFNPIPNAHLAVDFFFALSGFVIALSYENRLTSGALTFRSFLGARVRRLHPLIVLGMTLGAAVYLLRFGFSTEVLGKVALAYAMGLALIPTTLLAGPGYVASHPLNMPMWSLLAEYLVNIFYASTARWLTGGKILGLCAVGFVGSVTILLTFGTFDVGYSYDDWWWGLARVVFPFFTGVAIYRWWSGRGGNVTGAPFTIAAVALAFCLLLPSWPTLQLMILAIAIPALIVFSASLSDVTKSGVKFWLGYLSYPVYITHFPVIRVFSNFIRKFALSGPSLFAAFVLVVRFRRMHPTGLGEIRRFTPGCRDSSVAF